MQALGNDVHLGHRVRKHLRGVLFPHSEGRMKMNNTSGSLFLNAQDVAAIMSISVSKAYKVIASMNTELEKMGYLTIHGRVSKNYFETRIYGGLGVH